MIANDPFSTLVSGRMLEFFSEYTPWTRRLWGIGTALAVQEASEAIDAYQGKVLHERAVREACESAARKAHGDPGAGTEQQLGALKGALHADPQAGSVAHHKIEALGDEMSRNYLERWATALEDDDRRPGAERTSRAIAAHLLDAGFSSDFLHRWWYGHVKDANTFTISELVRQLDELTRSPLQDFNVLIVFTAMPGVDQHPPGRVDAPGVMTWLEAQGHSPEALHGTRYVGGCVLQVTARDVYAAGTRASEVVSAFSDRVLVGVGRQLEAASRLWIAGFDKPLRLRRRRRVEIRTLAREGMLYEQSAFSATDAALALLARLDSAAPATAVSAGWAAVESVLKAPGDDGAHLVAERLASIATCSFARRELTSLAYRRMQTEDELSTQLEALASSRERALAVAEHLRRGLTLDMERAGDRAAEARMVEVVTDTEATLRKVRAYIADTIRRMYRQRNLVAHGGKTDAVALAPTLRVAAPLVGAGFDVIAHRWFRDGVDPMRVAAQAEISFELLSGPGPHDVTRLIEIATH